MPLHPHHYHCFHGTEVDAEDCEADLSLARKAGVLAVLADLLAFHRASPDSDQVAHRQSLDEGSEPRRLLGFEDCVELNCLAYGHLVARPMMGPVQLTGSSNPALDH
jgi:hypothetical protein